MVWGCNLSKSYTPAFCWQGAVNRWIIQQDDSGTTFDVTMRDQILKSVDNLAGPSLTPAGDYPGQTGDFELNPTLRAKSALTPAAVLVPLVDRSEGMTVLLTQRTDHLNDHAGQISFPGGRVEQSDRDLVATALRETREEIGLEETFVETVGHLDRYETGTGYLVTPVVGFVAPGFRLTLDRFEVAEAFEVPLSFILDAGNHQIVDHLIHGVERRFHVFEYGPYYIWGATAGMLMNFYRRMSSR